VQDTYFVHSATASTKKTALFQCGLRIYPRCEAYIGVAIHSNEATDVKRSKHQPTPELFLEFDHPRLTIDHTGCGLSTVDRGLILYRIDL